jgi:hypothetical protein
MSTTRINHHLRRYVLKDVDRALIRLGAENREARLAEQEGREPRDYEELPVNEVTAYTNARYCTRGSVAHFWVQATPQAPIR